MIAAISEKLDVNLVLDELDQGAIKISWGQYSCAGFRGHVTGYHIKYCLVQNCEGKESIFFKNLINTSIPFAFSIINNIHVLLRKVN